jgi:hypothetical protein
MTAITPPETFPLAESSGRRLPAVPLGVRVGNRAMTTGTLALVAGVLLEMSDGLLVANAPWLFMVVAGLERPLLACGQVLLVGGAIAARIARRRAVRGG